MKCAAIIAAAGSGTRMNMGLDENGNTKNKMFLPLSGISVLARTLMTFNSSKLIDCIVVVTREIDINEVKKIKEEYKIDKLYKICEGGKTRKDSVLKGLSLLDSDTDYVFIHDGARCLVENECIEECLEKAALFGAAAPGVKVKDSIKKVDKDGFIVEDVKRDDLINIQTPQVFSYEKIYALHKKAEEDGVSVTDDTAIFTHYGEKVYITEGSYENIKITTSEDMVYAEQILKRRGQEK